MDIKNFWKKYYRFLLLWGVIIITTLIVLFVGSYPELPKGLNRWILILLIGPPLWLASGVLFERYFAKPTIEALNRVGDKKLRFVNKILAAIIVVPLLILIIIGLLLSLFK